MNHNRRQFLTTLAAGSATVLAACGGGGDGPPPTRLMSLLNLNPEAPFVDVTFGSTLVASGLGFPDLIRPSIQIEYGSYDFAILNTITRKSSTFLAQQVDGASSRVRVYYRDARLVPATTVLGFEPRGLVNLSDITGQLDFDLWERNAGSSDLVQTETLGFEQHADQRSSSSTCRLLIYPPGGTTGTEVYDSGEQFRTDAILVYPRFPAASPRTGEVAVVGLNYLSSGASMVAWANLLG